MTPRPLIPALLIAAAAFPAHADPASEPAAPTQPATAPATQPAPEEVVITYFTAIAQGDRDKALAQLFFANDAAKKEATAAVGLDCVSADFTQSITDAFPLASLVPAPSREKITAAIRKSLSGAATDIQGNTAELIVAEQGVGSGRAFSLVNTGGQWKIDFIRMQRRAGIPAMDAAAIDATLARIKTYDAIIANIKAGKYKSAAAANEDLANRLDATPPAPAVPAFPATASQPSAPQP